MLLGEGVIVSLKTLSLYRTGHCYIEIHSYSKLQCTRFFYYSSGRKTTMYTSGLDLQIKLIYQVEQHNFTAIKNNQVKCIQIHYFIPNVSQNMSESLLSSCST